MEYKIIQLDPHNTATLISEYSKLKGTCPNYSNLTMEEFLDCRDSIYAIADVYGSFGHCHDTIAIIGIKESTAEDVGIEWMDFYCKPDHKIYSIEFLHYGIIGTHVNFLGNYVSHTECCMRLIEEALADKNDGFVALKMLCPTGKASDLHDALYKSKFTIVNYDPKTETYLYIRMPQMHLHRIDMKDRQLE
ncbi:MAG: hypothetical protein NC548_54115 [Lachnospiraceae bacterium]|nr:hypothetical protein [Lachnospiraceae bacterium]